jgi:Lrp/AsnC family transcriptional regulator for asnA, asnC and gidA
VQNKVTTGLDQMDLDLLALLQNDGRITTRRVASLLNITEITARKRLKRLLERKIVTIQGVAEPLHFGYMHEAILNLKVNTSNVESAAATLASLHEVRFVAITTGEYALLCTVMLFETGQLLEFTRDKISAIDGVVSIKTELSLMTVKRASDWSPK